MAITDIKQLLPQDIYDAATGANAPSASNVFATVNDLVGGETLSQTLALGNIMDADIVVDASGGFYNMITNNAATANKYARIQWGAAGPDNDYIHILAGDGSKANTGGFLYVDQTQAQLNYKVGDAIITMDSSGIDLNAVAAGTTISLQSVSDSFKLIHSSGNDHVFDIPVSTATQTYTFRDLTGTVAFLSDIPAGGGGLSAVLTAGDTGAAGQNINLVNSGGLGYLDINNANAGPGGTSSLRLSSNGNTATIETTGTAGGGQDILITTNNLGDKVILESPGIGGIGGWVARAAFDTTFQVNSTSVPRLIQFQDGDGTVAFLTDIPTNAGDTLYATDGSIVGNRTVTGDESLILFTNTNFRAITGDSAFIEVVSDNATIDAVDINLAGNAYLKGNTLLSVAATTQQTLRFQDLGATAFDGDLRNADLTAARTWDLPDRSGTLAINYTANSYTNATSVTTARGGFNADSTTIDELADNLGTLIADLKTVGILS